QIHHFYAAPASGQEGRGDDRVLDASTGEAELAGEVREIDVLVAGRVVRPGPLPDPPPARFVRKRELEREGEAAQKRLVDVLFQISRQDADALVLIHLLEEVGDL